MSFKEQEPSGLSDTLIIGNRDIPTSIGRVSVEINAQSLRGELSQAVLQNYSSPILKQRGQEMAQRLVMLFGQPALEDFINSRKMVSSPAADSLKVILDNKYLGCFFIFYPSEPDESVFYFDLANIKSKSYLGLFEEFRHLWLHERYHFVQSVQFGEHFFRKQQEDFLFSFSWVSGMGGLSAGGAIAGRKVVDLATKKISNPDLKISRRKFLRQTGMTVGATLGASAGLISLQPLLDLLRYQLPFTIDGQAEREVKTSNYSIEDLQKTFFFIVQ
jgi:hypothetical protein